MEKEDKVTIFMKKILDIIPIKFSEKIRNLLIQIFKFVIVGVIATIIDFVCLFIFKEVFHINTVIANSLSFTISLIYNYIASTKWVFDVSKNKDKTKSFILFIVFSIIGLGINDLIVWYMEEKLLIHYMIAKIVATAVVMVFNFITRKIFLEDRSK